MYGKVSSQPLTTVAEVWVLMITVDFLYFTTVPTNGLLILSLAPCRRTLLGYHTPRWRMTNLNALHYKVSDFQS